MSPKAHSLREAVMAWVLRAADDHPAQVALRVPDSWEPGGGSQNGKESWVPPLPRLPGYTAVLHSDEKVRGPRPIPGHPK